MVKPPSEWVLAEVEPIIDAELWNQCNQILNEQHKSHLPIKRVVNLFSGVVFCTCGNKMYVPSNSPKYTCKKCRNRIGLTDLEELFQEQLKTFLFSDEEISAYLKKADILIREKVALLATIEEESKNIREEMDRLIRLCHKKELSEEGFGRHYKPLEERLNQIEKQLPELQGEIDFLKIQYISSDEILSEAKDLNTRWPSLNETEKRNIIETITDKIIIDTNDIIIRLNYLPAPTEGLNGFG
jgi:site-specific DNA recombinase